MYLNHWRSRANEKHGLQNGPSGRAKNKTTTTKLGEFLVSMYESLLFGAYTLLSHSASHVHRQRRLFQKTSQKAFRRRDGDAGSERVARMHWNGKAQRGMGKAP